MSIDNIYAKKFRENDDVKFLTLEEHLSHVVFVIEKLAIYHKMDSKVAKIGAIIHDIGKASTVFQNYLKYNNVNSFIFRHEIASLFFISCIDEMYRDIVIDMVIAHHKPIKESSEVYGKGILNLINNDINFIENHLQNFQEWQQYAIELLNRFGIKCEAISTEKAIENITYVIDYCKCEYKKFEISEWKGLLISADHFASALNNNIYTQLKNLNVKPKLDFYNRRDKKYPLSLKNNSTKRHSLVIAPTGSGKTDFLFRQCKNRVFYLLPFKSSINSMYGRVKNDLKKDNPDLNIGILHSTSRAFVEKNSIDEQCGASIKILTPFQIMDVILGSKGHEKIYMDIKGCDIIMDEIHVYSDKAQGLMLELIRFLDYIGCNIHIGSATIPSILKNKIIKILNNDITITTLNENEKKTYDRRVVKKIEEDEIITTVEKHSNEKVLIVCNTVKRAQHIYKILKNTTSNKIMLLHSKYRVCDRNDKEDLLINTFNKIKEPVIVVSTQIVEVSLDIDFDVMLTDKSPIDSFIQRIGRINRHGIKKYGIVYLINVVSSLPYDTNIVNRSYDIINEGLFEECKIQEKLDYVYNTLNIKDVSDACVLKENGKLSVRKLNNNNNSLSEYLVITNKTAILAEDLEKYINGDYKTRIILEIPISNFEYQNISGYVIPEGSKPLVINNELYSFETGLNSNKQINNII